jgi:O-antigen ligase
MKGDRPAKKLDAGIETGIRFLLLFTPLAFATVQEWSAAVMEIAAFLVLGLWLVRVSRQDRALVRDRRIIIALAVFTGVVLLQLVPLPEPVLRALSPPADAAHRQFGGSAPGAWNRISIHPWATGQDLLKLLAYASVFIVIINHVREREQADRLFRTIVVVGFLLLVIALAQKAAWNGRIFGIYPVEAHDESVRNFAIWGPFVNRNHFAGYLAMIVPLGAALLLYRAARSGPAPDSSWAARLAVFFSSSGFSAMGGWGMLSLMMTAAVFATLSRGGIIALVCSLAVLLLLAGRRLKLRPVLAPLAVVGLLLLVMLLTAGWDRIAERFEQLAEEQNLRRAAVWSDSLRMFGDFPLLGTGWGTFGSIYARYQTHSATAFYDHAHNDYVELLTDAGLIGFAAAAGLAGTYLVLVIRQWRARRRTYVKALGAGGIASCSAMLVHGMTDFTFHIPANALLLTVIAGLTYAVVFNVGRGEEEAA